MSFFLVYFLFTIKFYLRFIYFGEVQPYIRYLGYDKA